jgi:hypothetical protein
VLVPFWLVWAMAGRKATSEVWPAALTAGASFGVVQFLVSNFIGPEQPAADHGPAVGAEPGPHHGRELQRRGDGQDDRRQSIVVVGAATGQQGVLVFLQSDLLFWMIPG